jgi:hypothetical protein
MARAILPLRAGKFQHKGKGDGTITDDDTRGVQVQPAALTPSLTTTAGVPILPAARRPC